MIYEELFERLAAEFRFSFTEEQARAAAMLAEFVYTPIRRPAFILRGYAGTGKTTLIGALVKTLCELGRPVVLLAPTGRAAKVFAAHAAQEASTIHKVIYRQETFNGEQTRFNLNFNRLKDALFIVDEASMLSGEHAADSLFGSGALLDDLIEFVYQREGCRLLLVGDTAQLPPVGDEESPALNANNLRAYGLAVGEIDLTEVVRQHRGSDVLSGATHIRTLLAEGFTGRPVIQGSETGEVRFVPGDELIETLITAYGDCGTSDTIVITRSNKRANVYNAGIRDRIFDREGPLTRGDRIMIVKNNYYWTERLFKAIEKAEARRREARLKTGLLPLEHELAAERPPFDFIANGETAEVIAVHNRQDQFGFHFADCVLRFDAYRNYEMECRVLLDTLTSESPSLTTEERRTLYENVLDDYESIPTRRERMKALRQDPYYNALQIKYAYAVTCHKAQGGQWERVFVDQGYVTDEMMGDNYLRWLYTAFTRTTDRLYLVNWPEEQQENLSE